MSRDTQTEFIAALTREANRRGMLLRDDSGYANTGHLVIVNGSTPLARALADVGYQFQETYATFHAPAIFDEATRPLRVWHHADYALGYLATVLALIATHLDGYVCKACKHPHAEPDDAATDCPEDGCPCEGVCNDCGRPVTYGADENWHHKTEPERACFLIGAEVPA